MKKTFFIACSGADVKILEQCPHEKPKFIGIGMVLLSNAILITLAFTIIMSSILKGYVLASVSGVLFGAIYFYINRSLLISIRSTIVKIRILGFLFWLAISLFTTIIISATLKLEIFENSIKEQYLIENHGKTLIIQNLDIREKSKILDSITKFGDTIWWTSTMLFLFVFLIEVSPLVLILLSKKGIYEFILQKTENEAKVNYERLINMQSEVQIKTEELKLQVELAANSDLLNELAAKQSELAKIAIDKWYNDEIAKITIK